MAGTKHSGVKYDVDNDNDGIKEGVWIDLDHPVQRLVDGEVEVTEVEIGAVGSSWTEVIDGVRAGDEVVLAELDAPLPGSATEATSGSGSGFAGGGPGGQGGFGPPPGFGN